MNRRFEALVARFGAAQLGLVTRAQLLEGGMPRHAVDRQVRSGRLRPVQRGVYLCGPVAAPYMREMAALLACGPEAALSHWSSATVWGYRALAAATTPTATAATAAVRTPAAGASATTAATAATDTAATAATAAIRTPAAAASTTGTITAGAATTAPTPAPVDLALPRTDRGRRPGIRAHRLVDLRAHDLTTHEGLTLTTVPRTVFDLARVATPRELERVLAWAERRPEDPRPALGELLDRTPGQPGTRLLRTLLEADGGPALTRSEAEERLLALIRRARLPEPRVNGMVEGFEVDFHWPAARLVMEVDGYAFHATRQRFERDRKRDAQLAAAGWRVVRVTWRQIVEEPEALAARLGRALGSSAELPRWW